MPLINMVRGDEVAEVNTDQVATYQNFLDHGWAVAADAQETAEDEEPSTPQEDETPPSPDTAPSGEEPPDTAPESAPTSQGRRKRSA